MTMCVTLPIVTNSDDKNEQDTVRPHATMHTYLINTSLIFSLLQINVIVRKYHTLLWDCNSRDSNNLRGKANI